jgi:hypothetical protein
LEDIFMKKGRKKVYRVGGANKLLIPTISAEELQRMRDRQKIIYTVPQKPKRKVSTKYLIKMRKRAARLERLGVASMQSGDTVNPQKIGAR